MSDNWNTLREQIEYFSTPFPEQAFAFADEHREELAPFLIEAVARIAEHPEEGNNPDYVLHLYAMHLLAAWRETAAYRPMVKLGRHPDDIVEVLLSDSVTESYGRCLAAVCDGDLAPLYALIEDTQASHWARDAALDALLVRVFEGDGERDELIAYLIRLGDAEASRLRALHGEFDDLQVLDSVVSIATDLCATEMLERIQGWFEDELLDPMIADLPWVEKYIARPVEISREEFLNRGKGYVRSVKDEIGWWAGSQEPAPASSAWPEIKPIRKGPKVGRNDPCPCGSGKKFKKCCGA